MSNNQNSIKNRIKRYFLTKKSDIKDIPKQDTLKSVITTTGYSPLKYKPKVKDLSTDIQNPAMKRAMKALQLSNPFKGV